ncbi:nesprin-3 [Artibeus jamaicensis]|uniref:nesprin-3 n=1 Tax=Artibeus jamaicensis TaxID=9417 RepID=UPI00235B20AC|nr:nesprin-3 [Artibeus jamaicensis]XP_053521990.1 nesprin-3 [Artibeus jamaicensis]XP_053521992.1 nesprin-3 [Artibeus jamaicensis]XP_053521993.1 nesprin-3 [Artibeus jamaicensis]
MTQQPQDSFDRSVEDAQEWMKAVQDRLQANDDTQGPRAALEARLLETEKICHLEPEGRLKVDLVVQAAQALLACCPEDQKPEILAQLRDIKAQWEETVTYMTHCHSRIEWVWLHWSEYLLAQDEFHRWFQKMTVVLEPPVEQQLGLKEKQWQLSHAQVLLHNVDSQAVLLNRLLEEAASLFHRIGDPSVDEDAQARMKAKYDAVKAKAQDRVGLLEQVTQEHERYQASVDEFQLWLQAVVEKVQGCVGRNCKLTHRLRLSELQGIAKELPRGEESLKRLEEQAVGVIQNTSPLGAEKLTKELEKMREVLEKLRALQEEEEEQLHGLLSSEGAFEQRRKLLEAELGEFRKGLQRLAEDGLEPSAKAGTEDELVARWRRYSATRAALAAEEPRVDRLQAQLKELMVFPHDLQLIPDSVVAALQEFQSMKAKSTRLRNATGVELWQRVQRPLQGLQLWRDLAQRLLDVTASLPDLPSIHTFLPQIEAALMESSRLKQQLTVLQLKKDLLGSVCGQDRSAALLEQVASSVRDRDLLHNSLLQRKSKLQSLLAQHTDFRAAFEPLQEKLSGLQVRVQAENGLQRNLPAKQAQLSRLQGLQEEGLDLGVQVEAARPFIQGNPSHQHKVDQLSADCQALQRSLEGLVDRCQRGVQEHCAFGHKLLELRQWVAMVTRKLESYLGDTGPWDAQSREAEVERLLAEFPEKEAQLPLIEAHGQLVMEKSSSEGAAAVQEELEELAESWRALRLQQESLLSLIRNRQLQRTEVDSGTKMVFTNNIPKTGFLITPTDPMSISRRHRQAEPPQDAEGGPAGFPGLLRNFEQWLQGENAKLVRTIAMRSATAKDARTRETKLQELEARVPEGQHLFENLLRFGPARGTSEELEDLRYRWMLYKSKLKDSSQLLTQSSPGPPTGFQKAQRGRGPCALFRKACCVALPLQLLLLMLLLLLLLLPVGEDNRHCALSNNFARSFMLMLRYNGPPPT